MSSLSFFWNWFSSDRYKDIRSCYNLLFWSILRLTGAFSIGIHDQIKTYFCSFCFLNYGYDTELIDRLIWKHEKKTKKIPKNNSNQEKKNKCAVITHNDTAKIARNALNKQEIHSDTQDRQFTWTICWSQNGKLQTVSQKVENINSITLIVISIPSAKILFKRIFKEHIPNSKKNKTKTNTTIELHRAFNR